MRSTVSFPGTVLAIAILAGCASEPKPLLPLAADDPEFKFLEIDRATFRAKKDALITEAMDLDEAERGPFWDEYRRYEEELRKVYDDQYRLIRDYGAYYGQMTNEIADNLAQRALAIRQRRHDLARKYYQRIKRATSAITASRFLQVESEINLLSDLKMSREAPLFPKGTSPAEGVPRSGR